MSRVARIVAKLREHPVLLALLLALVVRVAYFGVAQLGVPYQRHNSKQFAARSADGLGYSNTPVQAIDMWTRWDGARYLEIARDGYARELPAAFFPLYPLSIRALADATGVSDVGAGLLLANICAIAAWVLLAMLAAQRAGDARAALVLALFAAFPTRNFEMSIYTEGLFLLLSLASFLAYERRLIGLAAFTAALASATRPQGVLVGGALFADALVACFRTRDEPRLRQRELALLALFPAGLVAYSTFLYVRFGKPLLFMQVQGIWRRTLTTPAQTLMRGSADPHVYLIVLLAIALVVLMAKRRAPVRDVTYTALSLAVPLSSGSMQSLARFVGVLFPLFIFGATLVADRPRVRWTYFALAIVLSAVFAFKVGQAAGVT